MKYKNIQDVLAKKTQKNKQLIVYFKINSSFFSTLKPQNLLNIPRSSSCGFAACVTTSLILMNSGEVDDE